MTTARSRRASHQSHSPRVDSSARARSLAAALRPAIETLERRTLLSGGPVAVDDVLAVARGAAGTVRPLANDADPDHDPLTVASFTQPSRGTVVRSGDGLTYTPAQAFQGRDRFTYTVSDGHGGTATGTVTVAAAVADLPGSWSTFGADAARTGYAPGYVGAADPIPGWTLPAVSSGWQQVTTGGGRAYVSNTEGYTTQRLRALDPATGAVLWTHTWTYSSSGDHLDQATYYDGRLYVRTGAHSGSQMVALDAATGAVVWQAANSTQWDAYIAPAVADIGVWGGGGYYGGMQGWRFDGTQINFIYGPQEDNWGPAISGQAVYRLVAGTFRKTDATGKQLWSVPLAYSGPTPVLTADRAFVASSSGLQAVDLATGATVWTAGGTFTGSAAVAGGVVYAISASDVRAYRTTDGTFLGAFSTTDTALAGQPVVTDDALFVASATATYLFALPDRSLRATLPAGGRLSLGGDRLYVAGPDGSVRTYALPAEENAWPTAAPDAATTPEEVPVTVAVAANDVDADRDPVTVRSVAAPAHGTAALNADGTVTYTPATDYFGTDTFTYAAADGRGGRATGTVTVTVAPVNDPPVARSETFDVPTNAPSPVVLTGTDVDGDRLAFAVPLPPLHGTLAGTGPAFTYTPAAGFHGTDTFAYTVSDGTATSGRGTVTLNVDDAPVAADQTATAYEDGGPVLIPLAATDPNGDAVTFAIAGPPAHGTATLSGSYVRYTPAADYAGPDALTFTAADGVRTGAPATLRITVVPVNDRPVAAGDALTAAPGVPVLTQDVRLNDADVDGDGLTVTGFTPAAHGAVQRFDGGRFRYVADPGYAGPDAFTYTVADAAGDAATATVTVDVTPAAAAPGLAGEWRTFGNGAAHAGYFPGAVAGGRFEAAWSLPATSAYYQPVVAAGRAYLVSRAAFGGLFVSAVDPATGAERWRRAFASGHGLNPATFWDGRLYLQRGNHGGDTQLWALDAADGTSVWSAPFAAQWETYFAPAVDANGIWIDGGYYGGMYGFRHDGTQIRFVNQAQYDQWTPSLYNGDVYAYVAGTFAKYTADGTPVWSNTRPWDWSGWSMYRTPALADGRAFLVGRPDLYAVGLADGATRWTVPGWFSGTPAVAGGTVYAIRDRGVEAYDAATGAFVRAYTAGELLPSRQPLITDDAVIVASDNATYVFQRSTGALAQKLDVGGEVAVADDTLYVTPEAGGVRAFRYRAPPAAPSAPDLSPASDTGPSAADDVTADDTPTFTGTAAAGAAVALYAGPALVGAAVAGPDGAWSITSVPLAVGAYDVTAVAGPTSVAAPSSAPLRVTIQPPPPPAAVTRDVRAAADAYARDGASAAKNFGLAADLQAGRSAAAGNTREAYLRFPLAGSAAGATVDAAVLRVFAKVGQAGTVGLDLYAVASTTWGETTLTWNARPAVGAKLASKAVSSAAGAWVEFDVSAYVKARRAAGATAVAFALRGPTASAAYASLASDEATANRPALRLTESVKPAVPKVILSAAAAAAVPEGKAAAVTVKLSVKPAAAVTLTVARTAGDADLSATPATLTFTPDNWAVAQTLTVTAAEDADAANGSATFAVGGPGVAAATLTATEADNDVPAAKTLRASADATVRDGTSAGTNYGSAADLQVRRSSAGGQTRWTLLKFDLSALTTVSSATLRLAGKLDSAASPSVQVQAFAAANASWTELGVTWSNKPAPAGAALGTLTVAGTTAKWYALDLTAWLKAQKAAGKTTAALVLTSPVATAAAAVFGSDEAAADRPELVVKP